MKTLRINGNHRYSGRRAPDHRAELSDSRFMHTAIPGSHPTLKPAALSHYRPDLPAWPDAVIGKALDVDPTPRFGEVIEFAHELENGTMWAKPAVTTWKAFYERNPLRFRKLLSAGLIFLVAILLARNQTGLDARPATGRRRTRPNPIPVPPTRLVGTAPLECASATVIRKVKNSAD